MTSPPTLERPLPGNPNCLAYVSPTRKVLYGRTWLQVLELLEGIVGDFHRACGLDVLAGVACRVVPDRRNRPQNQLALYVQLDGPATPEQIDGLDARVAHHSIRWSSAHIERVPDEGVPVLFATGGKVHVVVVRGPGGELGLRRFGGLPSAPVVETVPLGDLPDGECPTRPLVVLGRSVYGEAEQELERMRLAFAHAFAQRIVEADGVIRDDEKAFMDTVFSDESLARLGLGTPAAREQWLATAIERLRDQLGYHDKLALIGLFFSCCYSDGTLDAREMRVLKDAADALGVDRLRVVKYLRRFW